MKGKRGFTLTELLAVIVLLGVILAIAIPSYQRYINKANERLKDSYEKAVLDAANQYALKCIKENNITNCSSITIDKLELNNIEDIKNVLGNVTLTLNTTTGKYSISENDEDSLSAIIKLGGVNIENITDKYFPSSSVLNIENKIVKKVTLNEVEQVLETKGITRPKYKVALNNISDGENIIKIEYNTGDSKEIIFNGDVTKPVITTTNIDTNPTNKIEFNLTITDNIIDGVKVTVPEKCIKEVSNTYTCTITSNGSYKITAVDKALNQTIKTIVITNITSVAPSIIINPNGGELGKSRDITLTYASGIHNNSYIGFNNNAILKYSLIDYSDNQSIKAGQFNNLSLNGSEVISLSGLTGRYGLVVDSLTNKAGNTMNGVTSNQIYFDNTPPQAAIVSKPEKDNESTKSAECGEIDSEGNRTCKVIFYGGLLGAEVKAKLNFNVEDEGYGEVNNVYYRTSTTGEFIKTTIDDINNLPHKDFSGKTANLYIEVVFDDTVGNIDFNTNITKINFVKN